MIKIVNAKVAVTRSTNRTSSWRKKSDSAHRCVQRGKHILYIK